MSAPLLVVNARPWSGTPLAADAVLLHDGLIQAVGARAALAALGPGARVIDAEGATITPGLVDAHLHLVPWACARRQLDLADAPSRAGVLAAVSAALAESPPGETPLIGRGWDEHGWEAAPDRASLDAIAPSRPVLLHRHDFHALWVNGAAYQAAGIGRDTADPAAGRFERDSAGELSGLVRENAVRAFQALEERAGPVPDDALLDQAAHALHVKGITSVHDYQRNAEDWKRMRALAGRRRLRVLQHVGSEQVRGAAAAGLRGGAGDDWFRTGSLKLFADGTLGSRTAAMLEPYDDTPALGMALLEPEALGDLVGEGAAAGFSVAIHAIGDRAVRNGLDAIAAHREALSRLPLPPRLEHVQLVDESDLPRFAMLGVAASMQPQHAATDAAVARLAWGRRCRLAYAWRSLHEAGVPLAFGSDAPVEPPDAPLGLACAVARLTRDGAPFQPEQAIPLDLALHAYTAGAARLAAGRLGRGTLEPGEPADLVVWDRDLHRTKPGDLAGARPRVTVLAGEIVYDSG